MLRVPLTFFQSFHILFRSLTLLCVQIASSSEPVIWMWLSTHKNDVLVAFISFLSQNESSYSFSNETGADCMDLK